MSGNFQFENHPDAELLNAFAEQALEPGAREEILAHLGGCSRCREIVFLASEASGEEVASAEAALPTEPRGSGTRAWLRWRLVWVPVFAVSAVILVALAVHMHRAVERTETAKATQPQAMNAEGQTPAPQQNSKTKTVLRAEAASRPVAVPADGKQPEKESAETSAARVAETREKSVLAVPGAVLPLPGTGSGTKAILFAPRIAVASAGTPATDRSKVAEQAQLQTQAENILHETKPEMFLEPSRRVNFRVASTEPETGAPRTVSMHSNAVATAEFVPMQKSLVRVHGSILPNGELPASTVEIPPRTLLLSSSGTLYLSQNAGALWLQIAPQWQGKAVVVRLRARDTAGAEKSLQSAAGAPPAGRTSPPQTFELVNDKGQRWVSTDGQTWTAE